MDTVYKYLELTSKICAVITAAAIVLSTAAVNILFPVTALLCLASGNLKTKLSLIARNPVTIIFLLFYGLFILGAFYSTANFPDILLTTRKYNKFLFAVFFIPLFTEERWRNYAINTFLAAIFMMLVASYLQMYIWLPFHQNGIAEIFKKSIEFNFLMAFAAYLCLFKIANYYKYYNLRSYYFWLWLIFLLFIVHTAIFRSGGRTGYFVFASLLCLFFFLKLRWRGLFIAIIINALLFGLAFTSSSVFKSRNNAIVSDVKTYQHQQNNAVVNKTRTSVGERILFVKNGIKLIKAHPVFGTGTGSFVREYATIDKIFPTHNPHNEYVYIAVQFGIFGLLILLLIFGIPLRYSKFLPEELKFLVYGVVLAITLGSLANSWLLDTTQGHFYVYFIALAFAALPKRVS